VSKADKSMRVLGMMSGTSVDGIDVAAVLISGAPPRLSAQLEAHHHVPFPAYIRHRVLQVANGAATTTADLSELNFLLGEQYARAALDACKKWGVPPRKFALIGSHGQTIFHLGASARFQGRLRTPSTLQIGDISVIAQRTGIATVGDFRPADMAAGGQGAPLVPFVDYLLYRDAQHGRVALNIGGIANVTVIPANARPSHVFAFDTGPGNMIIDALVNRITRGKENYDRDARIALDGRTISALLARLMREPYLRKKPPKSAGREQFGQEYVRQLLAWAQRHRSRPEDLVRTATLFTSLSIADAFRRFIVPRAKIDELIVSGGGARNPLIVAQLAAALPGIEVIPADRFGVPVEAKEAFAFAVLAYETWHRRANNLPTATGAHRPVVLGKIAYADGAEPRK
jgi:anhydro-N-acetylmuramic acid kinase